MKVRKGAKGLQGYWEPMSSSLRMQSQAELHFVDARNEFNKLSRLEILWTVRHCCLSRARFVFNCYKH